MAYNHEYSISDRLIWLIDQLSWTGLPLHMFRLELFKQPGVGIILDENFEQIVANICKTHPDISYHWKLYIVTSKGFSLGYTTFLFDRGPRGDVLFGTKAGCFMAATHRNDPGSPFDLKQKYNEIMDRYRRLFPETGV